jgi:hypothetical protein
MLHRGTQGRRIGALGRAKNGACQLSPCWPDCSVRYGPPFLPIQLPQALSVAQTCTARSCSLTSTLVAMLGLAAPALQPLIQCHGRVQRVQMITSLRNFGRARSVQAGLNSHPATDGFASPSGWACAAQRQKQQQQQRRPGWQCPAAQQLRAAGGVGSGGSAAWAGRAIRPGEVHVWWLDPAKVTLPVRQQVEAVVSPALGIPNGACFWGSAYPRSPALAALAAALLSQVGNEAELARCRELVTADELADCSTSAEPAVRRERLLARALVRCAVPAALPHNTHSTAVVL